jgi:hypothetical protein
MEVFSPEESSTYVTALWWSFVMFTHPFATLGS